MNKTEKLKKAYSELREGKILEFKNDKYGYGLYGVRCWIADSTYPQCKHQFIFWKCFGQSANRLGLNNLRWIVKTIGGCTSYDYKVVDSIWL